MDSTESSSCRVDFSPKKSTKKLFLRQKIDFKMWDVDFDKYIANIWSKKNEIQEEWEIDLANVDIKNVIASSTYGTVYDGVYNGQHVAVKVLDCGEDGHATAAEAFVLRASFQQEVELWRKLDHRNVTKFIGASMGTWDLKIPSNDDPNTYQNHLRSRACCVVLEYLQGGSLKNFLIENSRQKLSFKIVVQLGLDLARGLNYFHSKKIVHGDVKSENMLLEYGILKISGFGVARDKARYSEDMIDETGNFAYIAPEILNGKPYTRKSDVYSFGICLWEIYCCDIPYADLSFAEVPSAVVHKKLRPRIPKCCPGSFARILKNCWNVTPEKRPEIEEVVKLLEEIDTDNGGGMLSEDEAASSGCFGFDRRRGP